jgi:hypothetical protein
MSHSGRPHCARESVDSRWLFVFRQHTIPRAGENGPVVTTRPRSIRFRRSAMIALELFTLNFLWEMAQTRFYSSMKGLPFWFATWLCTRAAAADVALLALCFVIAALVARDAVWPLHPTSKPIATFFALCLLATVAIEHWAIATRRWSYSNDMPMIFGVGALPLLQWVLIPVLSVLVFRLAFRTMLRSSGASTRVRDEQD